MSRAVLRPERRRVALVLVTVLLTVAACVPEPTETVPDPTSVAAGASRITELEIPLVVDENDPDCNLIRLGDLMLVRGLVGDGLPTWGTSDAEFIGPDAHCQFLLGGESEDAGTRVALTLLDQPLSVAVESLTGELQIDGLGIEVVPYEIGFGARRVCGRFGDWPLRCLYVADPGATLILEIAPIGASGEILPVANPSPLVIRDIITRAAAHLVRIR